MVGCVQWFSRWSITLLVCRISECFSLVRGFMAWWSLMSGQSIPRKSDCFRSKIVRLHYRIHWDKGPPEIAFQFQTMKLKEMVTRTCTTLACKVPTNGPRSLLLKPGPLTSEQKAAARHKCGTRGPRTLKTCLLNIQAEQEILQKNLGTARSSSDSEILQGWA